jgi:hypothetical protein
MTPDGAKMTPAPAAPDRAARPPQPRDHHDDLVAEPLLLLIRHRTIVIQAVELLMVN